MRKVFHGRAGIALAFILGLLIATAATAGAASLITGKQIKDGSISSKDLSKAVRAQLNKAAVPGPSGAPGAAGRDGAPGAAGKNGADGLNGSAVAYARVKADGTLDSAHSKNITSASKNGAVAYYCIKPSVAVKHVVATLDFGLGEISASFDDNFTSCAAGDAIVRTGTSVGNDAGAGAGVAFWVVFN